VSVMYEETENFVEMEAGLSKGVSEHTFSLHMNRVLTSS
jgi:hypothetical protein